MSNHIDYRESFFQHPALTKITGDSTYTSLAKLERECKANGKSVSSTLGGGLQGHLGLVCSALNYNRVSPGVPFVRPLLPLLPDLTSMTAPQIGATRQLYADELVVFQAYNLIERTIIQQINTVVDDDCQTTTPACSKAPHQPSSKNYIPPTALSLHSPLPPPKPKSKPPPTTSPGLAPTDSPTSTNTPIWPNTPTQPKPQPNSST